MTTATDSFDARPPRQSRWEPKRVTTLADARRRTAFVRMLRFVLIGLAVVLGLVVVIQLLVNNSNAEPETVETVGENARMINPISFRSYGNVSRTIGLSSLITTA